jgi:hypothetical protein
MLPAHDGAHQGPPHRRGLQPLFPWLGLSGPPFVGGLRGSERSRELLGIWPTLVRRDAIEPHVAIDLETVA